MIDKDVGAESVCDRLMDEVATLKEQVENLTLRVRTLESDQREAPSIIGPVKETAPSVEKIPPQMIPGEFGWSKVSQELLLPRIAAVCFMLVFALILRTITDNGMIDRQLGSYLGTLYALCLIGWGWKMYRSNHRLAPVFPACGVLLLYSIIYETHVHFESLSSSTVYTILLAAECAVLFIGLRCRALVLLYFAVFGSTFVGMGIGFPTPLFALLGVVLILNNVAAHIAERLAITKTLQWYTLLFSILFWLLWTSKLNYALRFGKGALDLGLHWSLPVLALFFAFSFYTSLKQLKKDGVGSAVYHAVLPSVAAVGALLVALFVLRPWFGADQLVGFAAVATSAGYIGLVGWLTQHKEFELRGGKGFVVAASLLLIIGLMLSIPVVWALPVWAVASVVLTIASQRWKSGGVRVISYIFQLFMVFIALKMQVYEVGHGAGAGIMAATLLAGSSLWLYHWCRIHGPDYPSTFFDSVDRKDHAAVLLLVVGLMHAYYAIALVVQAALTVTLTEPSIAVLCGKSIILNVGAVLLMAVGLKARSREILRISVGVVVLGGLKVFFFDIFKAQGVPLVASVFSLGVVAVAGSMAIKKWQHYQEKDGLVGEP